MSNINVAYVVDFSLSQLKLQRNFLIYNSKKKFIPCPHPCVRNFRRRMSPCPGVSFLAPRMPKRPLQVELDDMQRSFLPFNTRHGTPYRCSQKLVLEILSGRPLNIAGTPEGALEFRTMCFEIVRHATTPTRAISFLFRFAFAVLRAPSVRSRCRHSLYSWRIPQKSAFVPPRADRRLLELVFAPVWRTTSAFAATRCLRRKIGPRRQTDPTGEQKF